MEAKDHCWVWEVSTFPWLWLHTVPRFLWRRRPSLCMSFQASVVFLLEPLVLLSAPSGFLQPLERPPAVAFVSELTIRAGVEVPSVSSCSEQHSSPVGGQGRSAPSWWALQKELGQSWQKASEFFPHTSQWCQGQSQRPVGSKEHMFNGKQDKWKGFMLRLQTLQVCGQSDDRSLKSCQLS